MKDPTVQLKLRHDLTSLFDALPDSNGMGRKLIWTKEADAFLLRYYKTKDRRAFKTLFCKTFFSAASDSLRRRWDKLNGNGND